MRVMIGVLTALLLLGSGRAEARPPVDTAGIEAVCREIAKNDNQAYRDCVLDERTARTFTLAFMAVHFRASPTVSACYEASKRHLEALDCLRDQAGYGVSAVHRSQ